MSGDGFYKLWRMNTWMQKLKLIVPGELEEALPSLLEAPEEEPHSQTSCSEFLILYHAFTMTISDLTGEHDMKFVFIKLNYNELFMQVRHTHLLVTLSFLNIYTCICEIQNMYDM